MVFQVERTRVVLGVYGRAVNAVLAASALFACSTTTVGRGDNSAAGTGTASGGGSPGGASSGGAESGGTSSNAGSSSGGSTGGIASTTGGADSGGAAGGGAPSIVITGLHGSAFDLGAGRVRIVYDFSTPEQALDWNPSSGATISIALGQLKVDNMNGMAIALLAKRLHTDHAAFKMTLLEGTTTNWYINTVWDGGWNPNAGFGSYHDYTGRVLLVNSAIYPTDDVAPIVIGRQYQVGVDQTESLLSWSLDGKVVSQAIAPLPDTDRSLGLGGWDSKVALDDVLIEGTLNAP